MWSHGHFHWNELMTRDAEKAKKFYADTIGWTFDAMPMPNDTYWIAKVGDTPVAGIFPLSSPDFEGVPESWMPYLAVDDIDARLKKATAGHPPQGQIDAAAFRQERRGAGDDPVDAMEGEPRLAAEHHRIAGAKPQRAGRVAPPGDHRH